MSDEFNNIFRGGGFLLNGLRIAVVAATIVGSCASLFAGKQGRVDLSTMVTPVYTVEGDAFVRHNGTRYNNRPLYCNHVYAIVLAGDKRENDPKILNVRDGSNGGQHRGRAFILR